MDYLTTYPPASGSEVLDIGCGWGLTGLFLAKTFQAKVTGIDIDPGVAPFMALQSTVNQTDMGFAARSFESMTAEELASFETIIGTDICFWDDMTQPLFDFISMAIESGVERVIFADPGRPPFWDLVDSCSSSFTNAEVVVRRIYEPWKTEKFILVITKA